MRVWLDSRVFRWIGLRGRQTKRNNGLPSLIVSTDFELSLRPLLECSCNVQDAADIPKASMALPLASTWALKHSCIMTWVLNGTWILLGLAEGSETTERC